MTIPKIKDIPKNVAEYVRHLLPTLKHSMTPLEMDLAVLLRNDPKLYEAVTAMIQARIAARAEVPAPDEPIRCKAMMERDRELQWLLKRLEYLYRAPLQEQTDMEQPA